MAAALIGGGLVKYSPWDCQWASLFSPTGVFSAITLLIATLGDAAVAAHQIAINVWDVFYIPMVSVGNAWPRAWGTQLARKSARIRVAFVSAQHCLP